MRLAPKANLLRDLTSTYIKTETKCNCDKI